ncbi:MAG: M6 family metalloprotease domain-containing protein [Bacteroidales bacterium]|nr:M6 family metalloprotease domain-containing protein [Bacteroidales bacterium]
MNHPSHLLLALAILSAIPAQAQTTTVTASDGVGKISYFNCPCIGTKHFPVIFVTFQDVAFSDDIEKVKEHFDAKFNQEGYSENGATGSVRDYFVAASNGRFTPIFDLYGVVELENDRAYYGGNNSLGVDQACGDMVIEAVKAMQDEITFKNYDSNKSGLVDDVVIIFAGESEYSGHGSSDAILPKSYLITFDKYSNNNYNRTGVRLGNVSVNSYTVINELDGGEYDGIGTFVHEFMHGLGLADVYSTYDTNGSYTPRYYDVMDIGIYNNDSKTPPIPSAFERFALGWMDLQLITGPCDIEMAPLTDGGEAYMLRVSDTEFFVLENRQQKGWDEYIPGHGMLVWHIDYDATTWYNNVANKDKTHQGIDLVEACGSYSSNLTVAAGYPFPGTQGVTELTATTTPALLSWAGDDLGLPITDIQESPDGVITAKVAGGSAITTILQDSDEDPAFYFDLNGCLLSSTVSPSPGLYIKRQGSHAQKVLLH